MKSLTMLLFRLFKAARQALWLALLLPLAPVLLVLLHFMYDGAGATFDRIANETKERCPVSRALKAVEITLNATLA